MHIPDGYLSPATCGTFYAASTPIWLVAGRRARAVVKQRYVPLIAISAAYAFAVMMFNVPIPDGTTAHAIGGVLVAVVLGPWAAVIAVSTALLIQALFFGDGGVLAFGANAFNMAIVMPFAGYAVYRVLARRAALDAPRRALAAGVGAYVGLNAAALCAAVEFGLQPVLFHRSDGTPLYAPFHLAQAVPAMLFAHLTIAGGVEFALTAGVVAYLQRANLPLLRLNRHNVTGEVERDTVNAVRRRWRGAVVGLSAMALLAPLGLLASGSAFGEGGPSRGFWHAAFDGYDFHNDAHPALGYVVSAVVGMAAIAFFVFGTYALARALRRLRRAPVSAP